MADNRQLRVDLAADMRARCGMTADAEADETHDPRFGLTADELSRITESDWHMGQMRHGSATAKAKARPTGLRVDLAADMRRRLAERQWPPVEGA